MDNKLIRNVLKQKTTEQLVESSLSRVYQHMLHHDIAIISACRKYLKNCYLQATEYNKSQMEPQLQASINKEIQPISQAENQKRKRDLYSILVSLGYSITKSQGIFIEDYLTDQASEVKENSFFVVNIHDDPLFKDNIIKLGIYFCQDSVLYKSKYSKEAVLIGTNNSEFPGFNKIVKIGTLKTGKPAEMMTKIGGRPFTFSEASDHTVMSRAMMKQISRKIMNEINTKLYH